MYQCSSEPLVWCALDTWRYKANYEAWVEKKAKHGSRGQHGLKFVIIVATQGPDLGRESRRMSMQGLVERRNEREQFGLEKEQCILRHV
jgi:hypothetical protein